MKALSMAICLALPSSALAVANVTCEVEDHLSPSSFLLQSNVRYDGKVFSSDGKLRENLIDAASVCGVELTERVACQATNNSVTNFFSAEVICYDEFSNWLSSFSIGISRDRGEGNVSCSSMAGLSATYQLQGCRFE